MPDHLIEVKATFSPYSRGIVAHYSLGARKSFSVSVNFGIRRKVGIPCSANNNASTAPCKHRNSP